MMSDWNYLSSFDSTWLASSTGEDIVLVRLSLEGCFVLFSNDSISLLSSSFLEEMATSLAIVAEAIVFAAFFVSSLSFRCPFIDEVLERVLFPVGLGTAATYF